MSVTSRSAEIRPWRFACRGLLVFLALLTLTLPGCGGCRKATKADADKKKKAEEAKKEKPKPKPDFERIELAAQPTEPKTPLKAIKPGHWMAATVQTKANNFDFNGELDTAPTNSRGELLDLERTPFKLTTSRPALLPKGQNRRMEVSLFVPGGGTQSWVTTHLRDRQSGREAKRETEIFKHMPGYQYFLLGLVKEPDRYRWLKVINSIHPPRDDSMNSTGLEDYYYNVQLPIIKQNAPLPTEALCWTSMAYVLWDDIDPTVLNTDQQQAMLDWLHWGGQLIISGPKTLDLVQHSFLEPYLPATVGSPLKVDDEALDELNAAWTIPGENSRPLTATLPWAGVGFDKRPGAEFLPGTGALVVEQRVGRGRIVATAFRLVERDLINWPSFDSFFNACLLRRPQRTYSRLSSDLTRLDWSDSPGKNFESERICQLRYFSRDTSLPSHPRSHKPSRPVDPQDEAAMAEDDPSDASPFYAQYGYGQPDPMEAEQRLRQEALGESGVAGWNDFGPVASEARRSLKQAAGITIPRSEFVLQVLLGYLIVLVPLNWGLFKLLGRVEWAWVAAPVIAIVCAVVVIWLAQLDIGFARSSTEIAVVELQGGYPRAHVTRYTALYTSLSTTYSVHLEQPSALALPFSTNPRFEMLAGQQRGTVNFRRDNGAHLTGYAVSSNATGMIHSEHMAELPGSLTLQDDEQGSPVVTNSTGLPLRDVGIIRRLADGDGSEIAWIGTLKPGGTAKPDFQAADLDEMFARQRESTPQTAHQHAVDALSLRPLIDLAEDPGQLAPGDVRLVAWLDQELPGMRIEPAASQERHATMVVANLRLGSGKSPRPDTNLPHQAKSLEIQMNEGEEDETGNSELGTRNYQE